MDSECWLGLNYIDRNKKMSLFYVKYNIVMVLEYEQEDYFLVCIRRKREFQKKYEKSKKQKSYIAI